MKSKIFSLFDLTGKVAIVTGGAMGIGKSIANKLAQAGAKVMIVDVVPREKIESALEDMIDNGLHIDYLETDLRDRSRSLEIVQRTMDRFGRIDILVNNAGIFKYMSALSMTEDMWNHTIDLNLKAAVFLAKDVTNAMINNSISDGRIINISSTDSFKPTGNLSHYDASKGGLRIFTKALAKEVGKFGITVNDIAPGGINTPGAMMMGATSLSDQELATSQKQAIDFVRSLPLQRMGEPEDIGNVTIFLASKASAYITGSTIVVDGGMLLV